MEHSKMIERLQDLEEKVITEYKMNIETTEKTRSLPISFTQPV